MSLRFKTEQSRWDGMGCPKNVSDRRGAFTSQKPTWHCGKTTMEMYVDDMISRIGMPTGTGSPSFRLQSTWLLRAPHRGTTPRELSPSSRAILLAASNFCLHPVDIRLIKASRRGGIMLVL
eukprot:762476-Hanusia_phi.AAC.5